MRLMEVLVESVYVLLYGAAVGGGVGITWPSGEGSKIGID